MRRGLRQVLESDLAGVPGLYAQAVDAFDGAYSMRATRVMEGYFVERNGRLEVHASVLDLASHSNVQTLTLGVPNGIDAANQIAKRISPAARAAPVVTEAAFHQYGQAISANDASSVVQGLEAATKDDPRFALAYLEQAKILLAAGQRDQALRAVQAASMSQPDTVDRAQLDYLAAVARGNTGDREKALASLAKSTPSDPKVYKELAELESAQRIFTDAVRSFEKAGALDPQDPEIWNQLGYMRAFAGDLNGARGALDRYQELVPPENANPLDSLGEVSFYLGDFAAAERYFLEADQKNREEFGGADLLKAAQARLMTGDLAGGNDLFQKYAAFAESRDRGRAAYARTQWQFLTGQRNAAMNGLEKAAAGFSGDGQSLAFSQLSFWKMQAGDRAAAAELANQAGERAMTPATRSISAVCRVIAQPPANSSGSRLADAYALLFQKRFADAIPLLELLYRETSPHADGQIRTVLGWAYVESNRAEKARGLIAAYPIPLGSGEPLFASLVFPRYLFVRGIVLQQEGKRAEAKQAYELFLKYSGDAADIFGDEAVARKNLAQL